MQVALIVLLVLVGTIPLSGITHANAETEQVPEWVTRTLGLWSDGKISNEEFVRAIDYLSQKGIVKISSTTDKELKRDVEYLKAKAEVFQQEVKELRTENEEYRILLKSQELNRSEQFPTSMSSIFDEYQALKKEVDRLRDTNKRMSTNIDAWVANFQNPELSVSGDLNQEGLVQVKSDVVEELNNLKKYTKSKHGKLFFNFNYRFSSFAKILNDEQIKNYLGEINHIQITTTHGLAFKNEYLNSWRSNGERNLHNILETSSIHYLDLLNYYFLILILPTKHVSIFGTYHQVL